MNKPQMFSTDVFDVGTYVGSPDQANKKGKRISIQQTSDFSDENHGAKKRCVGKQSLIETFNSAHLLKSDKFGQSSMFTKPLSKWTSIGAPSSNNRNTSEVETFDSLHSATSDTLRDTSPKDSNNSKGIEFVTTSIVQIFI